MKFTKKIDIKNTLSALDVFTCDFIPNDVMGIDSVRTSTFRYEKGLFNETRKFTILNLGDGALIVRTK